MFFSYTTDAEILFGSPSITVGEQDTAMVCANLVGVGGTNALGCDLIVTLTTDTGKAGTFLPLFSRT